MKRTTDELKRRLDNAESIQERVRVLDEYSKNVTGELTDDEREIFEREADRIVRVMKPALQQLARTYRDMIKSMVPTIKRAFESAADDIEDYDPAEDPDGEGGKTMTDDGKCPEGGGHDWRTDGPIASDGWMEKCKECGETRSITR